MQRDPQSLQDQVFDVLIIGAGSHGACAARDAALRGLKVALIDKGDIGGATSHNSLKTIHGGIRYLQHLNFKRSLESIKEQTIWLRTAPQLVKPLQFLMPTYGHGLRGPLAMLAGISLFALLGLGRNKGLKASHKIPSGRVMSKDACLALAPNIKTEGLTGGALWYDAQVELSDRTILQVVEHAAELGAKIGTYTRAQHLLIENDHVKGIRTKDLLNDQEFEIRARCVLNAAGPWAGELLERHQALNTRLVLSKNMNLVTDLPAPEAAMAVQSSLASDSKIGDSKRLYFIVPWLGRAVVGTTHFAFDGKADELTVDSDEIRAFVKEINSAYPSLNLTEQNILYCYQGLLPASDDSNKDNAAQLHESKVIDHAKTHNTEGLISILSVKWTTARLVAERAIDQVTSKLNLKVAGCTSEEPLIDNRQLPYELHELNDDSIRAFCDAHIQHSMAITLCDILLRRSNDLALGRLGIQHVKKVAQSMQQHFNWNAEQQQQQTDELLRHWLPAELRQQIQIELQQNALWTR